MDKLRRILFLHKPQEAPEHTARLASAELEKIGVQTCVMPATSDAEAIRREASRCDAVIVVAGDGSIIGAARRLAGLGVPIAGLNHGHVGFLAELPAEGWKKTLLDLASGRWQIEEHAALHWRILGGTNGRDVIRQGHAINDITISHGLVARKILLDVSVDEVRLGTFSGDALLLSTPLGSTAYNASAGGPLTMPCMDAQLLTPVCSSFATHFPHLVLPSSTRMCIATASPSDNVAVSIDGQDNMPLHFGEILESKGEPGVFRMLVSEKNWYLRRLVERGYVRS